MNKNLEIIKRGGLVEKDAGTHQAQAPNHHELIQMNTQKSLYNSIRLG